LHISAERLLLRRDTAPHPYSALPLLRAPPLLRQHQHPVSIVGDVWMLTATGARAITVAMRESAI
jgi:hypothetical protein